MKHRTATPQPAPTPRCYACGSARPLDALRPFGRHADGTTASHVCRTCVEPATVAAPTPRRNWYPHHATVGAAR